MDNNNIQSVDGELTNKPTITGTGNAVRVGRYARVSAPIHIHGNSNTVDIAEGCFFGGWLEIRANGSTVRIGRSSTLSRVLMHIQEGGDIAVGEDCALSTDIFISTSDMHPAYDIQTGARINAAESIVIGNHIWVGTRAIILKGSNIGDGSIIGAASIVTGDIPANAMAAGSPARVRRMGVRWDRNFPPEPAVQPAPTPAAAPLAVG